MKKCITAYILFGIFLGNINLSWSKGKEHRHEKAHSHSSAELNIAFDNNKGVIEFKSSAKGILGFESKPKSKKQIKKLSDTKELFQNNLNQMILFNDSLECKYSITQNEQTFEPHQEKHSDYQVTAQVVCKVTPKGSAIEFNFKDFADIKNIKTTILIDDFQKSLDLAHTKTKVDLK